MGDGNEGTKVVFFKDTFCRWMVTALLTCIVAWIICRDPNLTTAEISGYKLSFPLNAVSIILFAPIALAISDFLLWRFASVSNSRSGSLELPDRFAMHGVIAFLAICHLVLWAQFFVAVGQQEKCGANIEPLGFRVLVKWTGGEGQACHVMSSAKIINEKAWYFTGSVTLQAWFNTLMVAVALYFLLRAWRSWTTPLGATLAGGSSTQS
jgi:hypothetical protein